MAKGFRNLAGFGKRIEFWLIGRMLKEGLDVYIPLVDDFGIDAIIRKPDGGLIEARSRQGRMMSYPAMPRFLQQSYMQMFERTTILFSTPSGWA